LRVSKGLICEKGDRNHPLSDAAEDSNRIKSAIMACVERVFDHMTTRMAGKLKGKTVAEDRGLVGTQESDFLLPSLSSALLQCGNGFLSFAEKNLISPVTSARFDMGFSCPDASLTTFM
jgi:hypothetical protein